jgi:hypothetical protein
MQAVEHGMKSRFASIAACALLAAGVLRAQTKITPPDNSYSLAQDVQLGRDAAAQARRELPLLRDDAVNSYLESIGRRLTGGIPENLRHSEFQYTFETVNVREINAFALPGGPMFVNRGMLEAAADEGEIAGVMAHEMSHVVLRHGTAQASKATKYEIGSLAGAVIGAIIGGRTGSVIAQGTQFGLGTAFLRFSREYERQADIEGAQIMARAGYDPRDMANMFKTIEKQGGSNGPEWLSDHPNPGNRYDYISKEAQVLQVQNPVHDTQRFDQVRARLKSMPPAPTTEQAAKEGGSAPRPDSYPNGGIELPSTRYVEYTEGNVFRVSVPSNWKELPSGNSVTFAPEGAYGEDGGRSVFTHGVEIGLARSGSGDLQAATDALVSSLSRDNPRLSRQGASRSTSLGGQRALQTTLSNVSEVTLRRETIRLVTAFTQNGTLIYVAAVVPDDEASYYQSAFQRVVSSIRFIRS